MIYKGKRLSEISAKFGEMISELNEPNLPRTSLTGNRGNWTTRLVRIAQNGPKESEVVLDQSEETTRLLTNQNSLNLNQIDQSNGVDHYTNQGAAHNESSLVCSNKMSYIIATNKDAT